MQKPYWLLVLVLGACGGNKMRSSDLDLDAESTDSQPKKNASSYRDPVKPAPIVCAEQPDFRYEYIRLPPPFATSLPAGHEQLLFAPGMFERGSFGYWSYVFSFAFERPLAKGGAAYQKLLDQYYRGLVKSVGKGLHKDDAVSVELFETARRGEYFGNIKLVDVFGAGDPLELKLRLIEGQNCLLALASVQPLDADIWKTLSEAATCLPCRP